MPEKAIADKIDFTKSEQYILSIRLSTDGFSFSIYNPIRDCLVHSYQKNIDTGLSITANMKQAIKDLDFLSFTYKEVNVSLAGKRFTLIPSELFKEDQITTYFYYNFSTKENELVLYDTLPRNRVMILYGMEKSLYHLLLEQYPRMHCHSSITLLAEDLNIKSRSGSDKKMYAFLHHGLMVIYAYERGHLMLLNAYDCKNSADRVYYLLYAWKQLNMDQLVDELYIMGEEEDRNPFLDEMQRFIQHVFTLNRIPEYKS